MILFLWFSNTVLRYLQLWSHSNSWSNFILPFIISESDGDSSKERQHNRRSRTNFNSWQLDELERAFLSCHYPDVFMREALALRLALRESRVAVSFNQQIQSREKHRKKNFWLSVTCSLLLADNQWESKPFTSSVEKPSGFQETKEFFAEAPLLSIDSVSARKK